MQTPPRYTHGEDTTCSGGDAGMSASGSADGGDTSRPSHVLEREEPPVRRHGTRLVNCVSETGEKRVVVYEVRQDERWIDAAGDDVSELSEMR